MKIKELDFLTKEYIKKLGKYADMDIGVYIDKIDSQIKSGSHVNKLYVELYDALKKERSAFCGSDDADKEAIGKMDELKEKLDRIPLEEIKFHVDDSEYSKNYNKIKRKFAIETLGDLYSSNFPASLAFEITANKWKDLIIRQHENIIKEYNDFIIVKNYPETIKEEGGLIGNLKNGLIEISKRLKASIDNPRYSLTLKYPSNPDKPSSLKNVAEILESIYVDNKSLYETASTLGYTKEHIRNIHQKTIDALINGDVINGNIRLDPILTEWNDLVQKEAMFNTASHLYDILGLFDEQIFPSLGFDIIDIIDNEPKIKFIVPKGQKGIYSKVGNAVVSVLRDKVLPADKTEIFEKVYKHYQVQKIKDDFSESLIENILNCQEVVDSEKGLYWLKTEYLNTGEQQMARLIYDKKNPVLSKDVIKEFKEKYGKTFTTSLTTLKKFGLKNIQGNLWAYGDKELPAIQKAVLEFVEDKIIFTYEELEEYLISKGYIIPSSIRAYITSLCYVDNKNKDHFCHKSYVDDYSQFSWRNQSREGLTNWILNAIKDFIEGKEKVTVFQILNHVEDTAKDTEYEGYIRQRTKALIDNYSGGSSLFKIEGKHVYKNQPYYDKTNFSIIGLRGSDKYPFYSQIRSIILNAVKKSVDRQITLIDAISLVNTNLSEEQSRNTVIRALTNKNLPKINLEIKTIDNTVYIKLTGEEIKTEPIYEIVSSEILSDSGPSLEIRKEEERPPVSYRVSLDWVKLETSLRKEMSDYSKYMNFMDLDMDEGIIKFISFLQNAENSNLNRILPQFIYEYLNARTDSYDQYTYLNSLATNFEGLLSEIKYKKTGKKNITSGLGEKLKDYPFLQNALTTPPACSKLYERIFKDLYEKRNKFAHGEEVSLTTYNTAKTIVDYISLYIFTVTKYA